MGSITFQNSSRSVTLNHIVDYRISKKTTVPIHKMPGKPNALLDFDSEVTTPKTVVIRAKVSNSEKQTLELMETDRDVIDITDEHGNSYDNYWMTNQTFSFNMGSNSLPWIVSMEFIASSD